MSRSETQSSYIMSSGMSVLQTLTLSSSPAVTRRRPSGEKRQARMALLPAVAKLAGARWPERASHSTADPSDEHDATKCPHGEYSTWFTEKECAAMGEISDLSVNLVSVGARRQTLNNLSLETKTRRCRSLDLQSRYACKRPGPRGQLLLKSGVQMSLNLT